MKNNVLATATVALATMCLPVGVVLAQNADQGAQAAQGTDAGAATDQTAQGNGAAAGEQLQEVVVTAERRVTNLQTTPIAIQAISGDQLRSQQLNTISDLTLTAPAFQNLNEDNYFDNSLEIRGIGESGNTSTVNTEQGVLIIRDGMVLSESTAQDEPMFDIADVEVLEGPQSTLVGTNAEGGAIEINSVNPNFRGLNGYVEGQLGNYSDRMFQGAVNLPISDTFAMRLAFYDQQEGSFYKDIGSGLNGYTIGPTGAIVPMDQGQEGSSPTIDPGHVDDTAARLSLLWQPTDNFQAIVKAEEFVNDTGGLALAPDPYTYKTLFAATAGSNPAAYGGCTLTGAAINYPGASGGEFLCPGAGSLQHSTFYYPGETPYVLDYYGQEQYYYETQYRYLLQLNYTLPDGIVLRSQSGFNHIDIQQQNNVSFGPQYAGWEKNLTGPNDDYMQQEFDLISPTTGKFNWLAGTYWYYRDTPGGAAEQSVQAPYQPNQLPGALVYEQLPAVIRDAAAFAQINWQFTHTLQLQIGARENWDANFDSNYANVAPAANTVLSQPNGTGIYLIQYPAGCNATASAECVPTGYKVAEQVTSNYPGNHYFDSAPTGKVDLNWTPLPGQNFYAFYARGYKSGGTNYGSTQYPSFAPEALNDWEIGWKGQLFNGHMVTQVGGYYYNYQHMQIGIEDLEYENDAAIGSVNGNVSGASTLYGFTIAEQAQVGGLGVNLNFAYEHSALGSVTTLNPTALPPGWGSEVPIPQCVAGHSYTIACFNYTPYEVSLSGEQTPDAPEISGNISVDYKFPVGAMGVIDPRVIYSYTGVQYTSIFQSPYTELGARDVWNATVDWVVGKWDTQLYMDNITNDIYLTDDGQSLGGAYYGPPRQMGIQATYKF